MGSIGGEFPHFEGFSNDFAEGHPQGPTHEDFISPTDDLPGSKSALQDLDAYGLEVDPKTPEGIEEFREAAPRLSQLAHKSETTVTLQPGQRYNFYINDMATSYRNETPYLLEVKVTMPEPDKTSSGFPFFGKNRLFDLKDDFFGRPKPFIFEVTSTASSNANTLGADSPKITYAKAKFDGKSLQSQGLTWNKVSQRDKAKLEYCATMLEMLRGLDIQGRPNMDGIARDSGLRCVTWCINNICNIIAENVGSDKRYESSYCPDPTTLEPLPKHVTVTPQADWRNKDPGVSPKSDKKHPNPWPNHDKSGEVITSIFDANPSSNQQSTLNSMLHYFSKLLLSAVSNGTRVV